METTHDTEEQVHGQAPRTLTAALRMAIADARLLEEQHRDATRAGLWLTPADGGERSVQVTPDSTRWYTPEVDEYGNVKRCEVCLAGAIMVQRLTAKEMASVVTPSDWEYPWWEVLLAVDAMRTARWHTAAMHMEGVRAGSVDESEERRARFGTLMNARIDEEVQERQGQFRGWPQFGRFLDTMETVVLPTVEASERTAYGEERPTA